MTLEELIELGKYTENGVRIFHDDYCYLTWYAGEELPLKYSDCAITGWWVDEDGKMCVEIDYWGRGDSYEF